MDPSTVVGLMFLFIVVIVALTVFFGSFFMVEQAQVALIERFGKFARTARAGLNMKIPMVEKKAGRLSLRVQQLNVKVETKTSDNVFVDIVVSVQYHVVEGKEFDAFYRLTNPEQQITAHVFDAVRSQVPTSQRGWMATSNATRGVITSGTEKPLRTLFSRLADTGTSAVTTKVS